MLCSAPPPLLPPSCAEAAAAAAANGSNLDVATYAECISGDKVRAMETERSADDCCTHGPRVAPLPLRTPALCLLLQ